MPGRRRDALDPRRICDGGADPAACPQVACGAVKLRALRVGDIGGDGSAELLVDTTWQLRTDTTSDGGPGRSVAVVREDGTVQFSMVSAYRPSKYGTFRRLEILPDDHGLQITSVDAQSFVGLFGVDAENFVAPEWRSGSRIWPRTQRRTAGSPRPALARDPRPFVRESHSRIREVFQRPSWGQTEAAQQLTYTSGAMTRSALQSILLSFLLSACADDTSDTPNTVTGNATTGGATVTSTSTTGGSTVSASGVVSGTTTSTAGDSSGGSSSGGGLDCAEGCECEGRCEGTCELSVRASCTGVCMGTCSGECSRTSPEGDCNGTCDAACAGVCVLPPEGGPCFGTCVGTCFLP